MSKLLQIIILLVLLQSCNFDCNHPLTEKENFDYQAISTKLESIGVVELEPCFMEIKIFQQDSSRLDTASIENAILFLNHKHPKRDFRIALHDKQGKFLGGFYESARGNIFFTESFDY